MTAKRIILISAAVVVAGIGGCFVWFRGAMKETAERGKVAMAQGKEWGLGKTGRACFEESLRRNPAGTGIIDEAVNRFFMKGCVESAPPTRAECSGAPKRDEIMASVQWALAICGSVQRTDQNCSRMAGEFQRSCSGD